MIFNILIMTIKILFIMNGLFVFHSSEGKVCPERTRIHLTRCDMYFKCKNLTETNSHAWIPVECDRGLIYEHNLGLCVMPSDDWECQLPKDEQQIESRNSYTSSLQHNDNNSDDEDFHIINEKLYKNEENYFDANCGNENVKLKSIIMQPKLLMGTNDDKVSDNNSYNSNDDDEDFGSGMSKELLERDNSFLPSMKSTMKMEMKEAATTSKIDPKLTAQLQRLSQLIDGLKKTYQKQSDNRDELRPDQLNAFLAHFNIRNQYETYNPYKDMTILNAEANIEQKISEYPNKLNETREQQLEQYETNIKPEMKIFTKSYEKHDNDYNNDNYIMENKPYPYPYSIISNHNLSVNETSIYLNDYTNNVPKISKDTLNTVLELSKQMIATQHLPQILGTYKRRKSSSAPKISITTEQPILYNKHDTPFSNTNHHPKENLYKENYSNPYQQQHPMTQQYNNHQHHHHYHHHYFNGDGNKIDSYGQLINLYPPLNDKNDNHNDNDNNNQSLINETSNITQTVNNILGNYLMTIKPNEFFNTPAAITKYFTPSQHLDNYNINQYFPAPDNYSKKSQQYNEQQDKNYYLSYNYPNIQQLSSDTLHKDKDTKPRPVHKIHNNVDKLPISLIPSTITSTQSSIASNADDMKLINIGGNFINYEIFQQSILPFLNTNALIENNIEIITCSGGIGVRHPNISDCTRYYVCRKQDNKVLSFSCPSFTAFNNIKRICDSSTYKICKGDGMSKTVNTPNQIPTQSIAQLINSKYNNNDINLLSRYPQTTPFNIILNTKNGTIIPADINQINVALKPSIFMSQKTRKRKYYCKEGDKIPDQTSVSQYFVCYKNAQGQMKGHKMFCNKGLIFCANISMCTLTIKCN